MTTGESDAGIQFGTKSVKMGYQSLTRNFVYYGRRV